MSCFLVSLLVPLFLCIFAAVSLFLYVFLLLSEVVKKRRKSILRVLLFIVWQRWVLKSGDKNGHAILLFAREVLYYPNLDSNYVRQRDMSGGIFLREKQPSYLLLLTHSRGDFYGV